MMFDLIPSGVATSEGRSKKDMTMNPVTIPMIATGFALVGGVVGIPSLIVLATWAANAIRLRLTAGTPTGSGIGSNPDAILLLLKGMTEALGGLGRLMSSLGQFLLNGLAIVAVVGLVVSTLCWVTSRGLQTQAGWARYSAGAILVLALLPSLVLMLPAHNISRVFMLLMMVLCCLGLHSLWVGYAPPTP